MTKKKSNWKLEFQWTIFRKTKATSQKKRHKHAKKTKQPESNHKKTTKISALLGQYDKIASFLSLPATITYYQSIPFIKKN